MSDDATMSALTSDQFNICVSLAASGARVIHVAKNVTLNVNYYGVQPHRTAGNLEVKKLRDTRAIIGGVIGGVVALCLICTFLAASVVICLVLVRKRPVKKQDHSNIPLNDIVTPKLQEEEPVTKTQTEEQAVDLSAVTVEGVSQPSQI
jgi:hypothetical protein